MAATASGPLASFSLLDHDYDLSAWAVIPEPPDDDDLDPEYEMGTEEVLETLRADKWLFVPNASDAAMVSASTALGESDAARTANLSASMPVLGSESARRDSWEDQACLQDHIVQNYEFYLLSNAEARKLIAILLASVWRRPSKDGFSSEVQKSLTQFVQKANEKLRAVAGDGRPVIPEQEQEKVVEEAEAAMRFLVREGWLDVAKDFAMCLEAFQASLKEEESPARHMIRVLGVLINSAVDETVQQVGSAAKSEWQNLMQRRITGEGCDDLYGHVDVRAWPEILWMIGAGPSILDGSACVIQIRQQLCSSGELTEWTQGLRQASKLIDDLRLAENFEPEELDEIFNDRMYFHKSQRRAFLSSALRNASRGFVQEVLQFMDAEHADVGERDDEEVQLVMDLIADLEADVRLCANAHFQMQKEWMVGQCWWSNNRNDGNQVGCVSNREMSPEQICDHIEDDDNYEHLLKIVVKELRDRDCKFEAARMLARPKSRQTPTFETNRNDRQLGYLIGLYGDLECTPDRFGPIEEDCLALPHTAADLLYVDGESPEALRRLEHDTISCSQPMNIGIWWFWRCYNCQLDKRTRASFIALSYGSTLVIVDLQKCEDWGEVIEKDAKTLVRQILSAPHLLKVVHDLTNSSLLILQRAVIEKNDINNDPVLPGMSPVLDISVAVACVKHMQPRSLAISKLPKLTDDYLRMTLCMAEALSNFERRPLRESQKHYALTVAWCPLMILRALARFGILKVNDLLDMTFQLGYKDATADWDRVLHDIWMCSPDRRAPAEACAALDDEHVLDGKYGENEWENSTWVGSIPRPDQDFSIRSAFPPYLDSIRLSAEYQSPVIDALNQLSSNTSDDLARLYKAYEACRKGGTTTAAGGA